MPSGGCVIRYDGQRGVVWKIKYRDGAGVQVKETVGAERDGVDAEAGGVGAPRPAAPG